MLPMNRGMNPCFKKCRAALATYPLVGAAWLLVLGSLLVAAKTPEVPAAVKAQVEANYAKLPLSFELNLGQTDQEVNYLARGPGYNLFLTPREAVLTLKKPQAHPKDRQAKSGPATPVSGTVLRLQLVGTRPQPHAVGQDLLPGKVNYFIGRDPHRWHTGIPTYAKVKYAGVYPGVDLIYYGHQGQLEYDWVLAPGTDPKVLTLAIEGAAGLEVEKGELVVHTPEGDLHMHKPIIYQEGKSRRHEVAGGYVLKDKHHVGFEVASYDTLPPLSHRPGTGLLDLPRGQ